MAHAFSTKITAISTCEFTFYHEMQVTSKQDDESSSFAV